MTLYNGAIASTEFNVTGRCDSAQPTYGYTDVPMPANWRSELAPHHREILERESAISIDAIAARGYFSTDDSERLRALGFSSRQVRRPSLSLVIPLYNWRGMSVGATFRPDNPRNDKTGKAVKYENVVAKAPVLDVAPLTRDQIDDPLKPLIITEGAKKADSAASRGLCAINLNGVSGYRGRNEKGGITQLADWEAIALKHVNGIGRNVYICYDSDVSTKDPVEGAMRRLYGLLQSRGAVVKIIYLATVLQHEGKMGLDDFFAQGGTVADLFSLSGDLEQLQQVRRHRKHLTSRKTLEELKATGLPLIETNNQQRDDEINALANAIKTFNTQTPCLFHGPGGMVTVAPDHKGQLALETVTREKMQSYAASAARWFRSSEREGIRHVAPPRDLCTAYLADKRRWLGIPPIEGIVTAPFFGPNGELCDKAGYNADTQCWFDVQSDKQLPETLPTQEGVQTAKRLILDELLGEVAFADDASRAHAVALIILPFVRKMILGPTPLHLFDAPTQSSGKTFTAKICIAPFAEPRPSADKKDNDEEWRKSILAACMSGRSHIFLDNITGRLSSPMLATCITEDTITERALGGLGEITVPTSRVWVGTSNNAALDSDTVSRCVMIRLDTQMENPEGREYQNDPLQYIRKNRSKVQAATITLVRHWQKEGQPAFGKAHGSRFKAWANMMGGILQTAEIPGFLQNTDSTRVNLDPETEAWREFVTVWWGKFSSREVTANQLLPLALGVDHLGMEIDGGQGKARSFGWMLRNRRDKVISGYKITRAKGQCSAGAKWQLIQSKAPS